MEKKFGGEKVEEKGKRNKMEWKRSGEEGKREKA